MFDNLWVEKYRPATLQDIQLPDNVREKFLEYKNNKECPNLLFVGVAGIGKTSLAKITVNDILGCQYLYINASDENGIDTIRHKVTRFAQIKSMDGGIKIIILDEVDGLTVDAQRALRNTMEEYSKHCRFVLTANYTHKVIQPLHSRAQSYDVTPSTEQVVSRCRYVLDTEGVAYDQSQLDKLVEQFYPDLRKCINELQKQSVNGKLQLSLTTHTPKFIENIYKLVLTGNVLKLRKNIIENEAIFNKDYTELLRQLFDCVCEYKNVKDSVKQQHVITVAEHLYRSAFVLDQEINFFSCLVLLSQQN